MTKPFNDIYTHRLFHKMGAVVTSIADDLEDDGDRVFLGSTNDREMLAEIKDLYFQWRFDHDDSGPTTILIEKP